jgi:outer membrane protein assembly factor BamB
VTETSPALARYTRSMRRSRAVYYSIVGVIVVALGVFVTVAWSRGEVAHTSLHTVSKPPGTIAIESPSQNQQLAWHTTDRIAIGTPQWRGAIITFSRHTVGGRDAHTGRQTWSYTRTDRTVCTAIQINGITIAIYELHGNCDEVSAFSSGTGDRRWTRTLDKDGMPLNGHPAYQMTSYTLMMTTPSLIYAIDPITGLDRWTYERAGCLIGSAVLGSAGALISQTCTHPKCANVKFCGRGAQLFLRDGVNGRGDDSKPNADLIKWMDKGDGDAPVSADQLISAVNPTTHALDVLAQDTGKPLRQVALTPLPADLTGIVAVATTTDEVVWASGYTYAIRPDADAPEWTTPTQGPPSIVSTTDQDTAALATARISVVTPTGIGVLDGNDGKVLQEFSVPQPASDSTVYPLGTGFLIAGGSGIVAYR